MFQVQLLMRVNKPLLTFFGFLTVHKSYFIIESSICEIYKTNQVCTIIYDSPKKKDYV